MPRSIWKGSISFGLVNIPVGLYTAEKSKELHFNLLDRRNLAPIHYQRINSKTGKEVRWEDTVRGFEFEPKRYVVLSDEDLKRANPVSTQTVEIIEFVDLADISPIHFEKPYYLAPERKGAKAYALLRETLRRSGKVGIAKVVIRTRQYLAAVVPVDDAIVLNLMRFQDELRDASELDLPSGKQGVTEKELQMAQRLVAAMVGKWDPESYRDDFRVDVKAMIDGRVAAGQLEAGAEEAAPRPPARGKVLDLMSLLKRSVEEGGPGARRAGRTTTPAVRAAAKPTGAARRPPKRRQATPARHRAKRSA
ncbi:MAG TPA: Ku protein [Thermoanaerobaculia bacterium]|jgi:DNA end-binding protein Ku|nr:Ku protein [Thermoanaerobaculia bacterium]